MVTIPALGAGGPGFESRKSPTFLFAVFFTQNLSEPHGPKAPARSADVCIHTFLRGYRMWIPPNPDRVRLKKIERSTKN